MAKGPLGFGCMRLPTAAGGEIDIAEFSRMVDMFLERGFTYFDTSYVYHGGKSEAAVREALVKRHPRDAFTLATKFPTFNITASDGDKVEPIFREQFANCGVDYFDYYLLHNLNEFRYKEVVKPLGLFEFLQKKKNEGVIRNIGFSFHDSADALDMILSEHPEVDFVQIVLNYFDWESRTIQSRACYETIRRHGKRVVTMESVKGGMLARLPDEAAAALRRADPAQSDAAWALRFAASRDGILAVLSGMSSLSQVDDNTKAMQDFAPLTADEAHLLSDAASAIRRAGPVGTGDLSRYDSVSPKGFPAAALLDTWTAMAAQPDPFFTAEGNYYSLLRRRYGAPEGEWVPDGLKCADGGDITDLVRHADAYVKERAF